MSCAASLDLEICKGATFLKVLRWESSTVVFKPITGITKVAPPVITAAGHGVPDGWRVALTNVGGMAQINAGNNPPKAAQYVKSKLLTADTVSLPLIDASGYSTYTSGGILRYNQPVDLAGYTARMHIRASQAATTTELELTTENSRIALDNTLKTITLTLTAAITAAITWTTGVYDLELVSSGSVVTRLLEGAISIHEEVTR